MISGTDVLLYLRQTYSTAGRAQRQKLLYYIQAWSLVWTGRPVFADQIQAWDMGPVVRDAWAVDKNLSSPAGTPMVRLDVDTEKIIQAVFDFYGQMTGTQLIDLTHQESPWQDAYNCDPDVDSASTGPVISLSDMRRFYTDMATNGGPAPIAPALDARLVGASALDQALAIELARWAGANEILASR